MMASPDLLHFGGSFEKRNAFRGELLRVQTPVQGGIKTNGSLIRSHSGPNIISEQKSAGSPRRAANFTPRNVTNPDHLAPRADSHSSTSLAQDAQEEEDYDSDEDNHYLALYSKSVPSNFDQVIKATGDTCVVEENDADESPNKMLLSECPEFIPYLNPPSPSWRPGHHNLPGVNGDSIDEEVNTDDEIVYGFRSVDPKLHENGNETSTQDADKSDLLWELLEAQIEAETEAEDRLIHSLRKSNKSELSKSLSDSLRKPLVPPKQTKQTAYTTPGVESLMDCAANELDRLRVGAVRAVLRRPAPAAASTAVSVRSHPVTRRQEEKTQSTTGTLVSLLQIQLTELRRMADNVNKEFNNQLAHERALLELLELEHERVQGEVTQAERKGLPPPDLVNHLRHLKDRLEQQTALIDDLEYQYLEEKTKYEEERESLLVQLRLHQDSPLTRSNCEAQCAPDSAGAASSPTSGPRAENHSPNFFLNSSTDNLVHPSRSEGLSSNRKYHVDDASTTSPSSICNGFAASPVLPKSQSYGSGSSVEPLYSAVRATGVEARLAAVTPAFSAKEIRKDEIQQAQNGQREPQQQYKGEKSPPMMPNATFSDNGVQFTRPQASIQNQQALNAAGILSQYSNQDVTMSDAGLLSRNQSLKSPPSGGSPLDGRDFVCQSPSGLDSPFAPSQTDPGMNGNIEPYQSYPTGCYYEQPRHQQIQFPPVDEDSRSQPFHSSQSTVVTLSSQGAERGSGSGGGGDGLEPAYSDRQIFHAVPPLPPGSGGLIATTQSFISASTQQSAPVINCNSQVVMRTRTASSGRRVSMDAEARPLTRYLPVPDDVSFDLRNHLESICGHTLCSPTLSEQVFVETTCCSGFLYKIDSTLGQVFASPHEIDAFVSPATSRRRPPIGGGGAKGGIPHSGSNSSSSVMGSAFSFFRRRPRRRRWFVLDRRRRLLTYYSTQCAKAPAIPLKPKDVISFTDIIDVYPDHKARSGHSSSFCLLLMANTSLCAEPIADGTYSPAQSARSRIQTRVLSLAAPSPEAMRVWVDALFTCAGAYLCLPSRSQWPGS